MISTLKKSKFAWVFLALMLAVSSLVVLKSDDPVKPQPQSSVQRGLLSVPTNMFIASGISPQLCNTTNLVLYQGAVYDSSFTHDDTTTVSDCGSIKLPLSGVGPCPITGSDLTGTQSGLTTVYINGLSIGECPYQTGPAFYSAQIPVSGSTNYTFSAYYYSDLSVSYVGDTYFTVNSYTSSGTLIAPNGQVTSVDSVANSKPGVWEETLEWFTTPSNAAYVTISPNRYIPSTGPVSNVWIDDIALYPGWVHREETTPLTKTFDGTSTAIDALGNITVKRINGPTAGAMEPFFPTCIAPGGPGTHTFQWYANMGWNCIWTSNMLNYQTSSTWGSTNPLVMARAAVSSAVPDGMRVMMDVNEAVRGHFGYTWQRPSNGTTCPANWSGTDPDCVLATVHNWYSTIKDELASAMTNIVSHGLSDSLLGMINDAENKTSRRQRDRAVMALVDSTDRANNGGNRRWPIITNAGNPSIGRSYTKADGTPYTDMTGTYMVRTGPFEKMKYEQGMNVPAGYCQVQSGGYNYRAILYRCIAEGGKMFNLWSDGTNTDLAAGGNVGANIEYEPSFADFPNMFAEMNKLLPLIRQPLVTDWSVTSSNASVKAWPRSYNGVPYVILSNTAGTSQTTTLTFSGVTGTVTSLIDYGWSTGVPDSGTTVKNSGGATTVTLPAAGNASAVGAGGGTMVLRATGATVTTTAPGATTTTTTTTTTPPTTTTTTIPPSGTLDDTHSSITYSSGWATYSGYAPDYLGTLHESATTGATYSFPFVGNSFTLYGPKYNLGGQFSVSIDGGAPTTVSAYNSTEVRSVPLGTFTTSAGSHNAVITVLGTKESSSVGYYVGIDKITISGSELAYDWVYKTSQPTPPNTIALGSAYAVQAGVRINVTCDGTFPGVWWYRTTEDTGTITATVWSTSGTLIATEASTLVSAGPGWKFLPFTSPPSVVAGTQYIVAVYHPNGAYAYSTNGFTARSLTSPGGCLTIPASSSNNSVYAYSSSPVFPNLSYADSEYFISPAFLPSTGLPTTTTTTSTTSTTTTIVGTTTTTTTTSPPTTTSTTTTSTTTTVPPGTTDLDDFNSAFLWSGVTNNVLTGWKALSPGSAASGFYALSTHESAKAGANVTLTVTGTKVYLYGARGPSSGRFTVKVDGVSVSTSQCALSGNSYCDAYSPTSQKHALLWTSSTLLAKKHVITITVLGAKNPLSTGVGVVVDSASYVSVSTTTTTPPLLRWSEEFNSSVNPSKEDRDIGGNRTYIQPLRQNDYWQDASMGYEDFAGTSWNANVYEGIPLVGTVGFPINETLSTSTWSTWYGSSSSNVSGGLSIPTSSGVEKTITAPITGGVTYLLTIWGDGQVGSAVQPYIRAHNSGTSYIVPSQVVSGDSNGPLASRSWCISATGGTCNTYGYSVWKVTFASSRTTVDLRITTTTGAVIKKATLTATSGTGTQTLNPFSTSSGVMSINLTATPSWAIPGLQSRMAGQGQGDSVPNRVGGFLVTDRDYINSVTGQPLVFKGGYFEMKARFPDAGSPRSKGTFPAWWFYASEEGSNALNKGGAEIDIWEGFGFATGNPLTATLHFKANDQVTEVLPHREIGQVTVPDLTAWHTYGFEWRLPTDPGGAALRWYIDGSQVLSVTGSEAAWFTTEMSMRVNISADAGWFTFPGSGLSDSNTADPYRFQIDYIRAYSARQTSTPATTTTIRTVTTSPSVDCTVYNPLPQCQGRRPAPAAP